MRFRVRHLVLAALLATALAVPSAARAQVRQMPNFTGVQPVAATSAYLNNAATVGAARYLASPSRFYGNNGFGYGGGWGGYPGWGYGGAYFGDFSPGNTLQGAAAAINAQGQFNIQNQQARMTQQQVEQARVQTRRAQFDQYLYERSMTPSVNDIREAQLEADLRRVRNQAPTVEVWSGSALNTLLKTIQTEEAGLGVKGPPIPLDPGVLKDIHLTGGATGGVGALKNGQLEWPLSLQKEAFSAGRKKLDLLAENLIKQASAGKVDPGTLQNFQDEVRAMKSKVKGQIEDMTATENIRANRFCNELMEAAQALENPAAVNHFNGTWQAKGATVGELIDNMTKQGLTFGPATAGDEAAYNAVYRALASYDMSLAQMTARLHTATPNHMAAPRQPQPQ